APGANSLTPLDIAVGRRQRCEGDERISPDGPAPRPWPRRQSNNSATGAAPFSTTRTGRPPGASTVFVGSIPRAVQTVAMKSRADAGRSTTVAAEASVRPTAPPPFTSPPGRAVLHAREVWYRSPVRFTCAVG